MAGEACLRGRRPVQEALMRPSAKRRGAAAGSPRAAAPLRRQKKRRP